jgi:hypothetical protein
VRRFTGPLVAVAAGSAVACAALLGLDDVTYSTDGGAGRSDGGIVDAAWDTDADALDGALADGPDRVCVDGGAFLLCDDFDLLPTLSGINWREALQDGSIALHDAGRSAPFCAAAAVPSQVSADGGYFWAQLRHDHAIPDAGALVLAFSYRIEGTMPLGLSMPYVEVVTLRLGCFASGVERKVLLFFTESGRLTLGRRNLTAACARDGGAAQVATFRSSSEFAAWHTLTLRLERKGCAAGGAGSAVMLIDGQLEACLDLPADPLPLATPAGLELGPYAEFEGAVDAAAWRALYDDVVLRVE